MTTRKLSGNRIRSSDAENAPSRSSPGRWITILGILGAFGYCFSHGFSIDRIVKSRLSNLVGSPSPIAENRGDDWALIDGVRWFRVIGTDTAGVGYSGWVSEFAFNDMLPASSGEKDLLEKIGLPSIKERVKAAKQMKRIGDSLKQALKSP